MTTTFTALAAKSAKGKLERFDFDPGLLGDEQVEIAVTHCGICHSDLSMLDNDWGMSAYPFVPGHEVSGTVATMGSRVKNLKVGQRVGLGWFSGSCMHCRQCMSGGPQPVPHGGADHRGPPRRVRKPSPLQV